MNESKVRAAFPSATIHKTVTATTLMNFLELPADVKSWLLQKFTDKDGVLQAFDLSEYVKEIRLKPNDWNLKLLEARHTAGGQIKLLTKVNIEFDYANDELCFSLPEYGFPKKKGEGVLDWSVVSEHKKQLLNADGAWGEITLSYDCGRTQLIEFSPLCPYTTNLREYQNGRKQFTTTEWIDVLLAGLNFNPDTMDEEAKLTLLQRFLPSVEKRMNQLELSIKGSAKSYCYSQLSVYNWLTSGTVSRATAFYNNTTKAVGYFGKYDNVIWDECQTLKCANPEEMTGVLKPYLESGEIRIGNYCGTADAGLILVGNIDVEQMSIDKNMFTKLPKMFQESAFIDRFTLIIEGWNIGRFSEDRKYEGWGLSASYLTEMFHDLREEFYYRSIVDEILVVKDKCDARNFEAIKKICCAYLKLLFPHIKSIEDINKEEFKKYCLTPAIRGRQAVLNQLCFLDEEYKAVEMPIIEIK